MRLSLAQQKTYGSFKNKESAIQYKASCIPQRKRTDSKRLYHSPQFYLPEIEIEIWNQQRADFEISSKLCSELQRGDIFKAPHLKFYWHQFLEFIPQEVLPKSLLIKSLLLPYKVEAETYFAVNFKFLYVTNNDEFIIP